MKFECAYDELVPLEKLVEHPRNRNQHPERQIELLAKIIAHRGQRSPIVVSNRSGFITKGHGRLKALQKLGWEKAAVDYQDYGSEADEYGDMTADNKIAELAEHDDIGMIADIKEFDFKDLELLGLDGFDLPDDPFEAQADEDEIPENVDTRVKPGDIWQLGKHRLMCGDSTNIQSVEALMDGNKADMVFTDPPYGMKVVKKDGNNNGLGESIDGVVGVVGVAARGKYRPVIGDDNTQTAKDVYTLCMGLEIPKQIFWGANFYAEVLIPSSGWIVWDKENGEGFFADGELAWTNDEKQLRIFRHQWKGMIRDSERGQKRVHPTQKPIALAEWCFENYGDPKSVLDLFGGSGSTLIACEKTNRKCFMMELDPHYCDVILSRWEKYTGKTAKRLTEGSDDLDEVLNG